MRLLRFLPRFRQAYRELATLAARETWSRAQVEAFQLGRLNLLWRHAVQHVPYYRDLSGQRNLPGQFTSLAEFCATVPVLSKATVRSQSRGRSFLSECPGRGAWHRTGGSTGTPLSIYWAKEAHLETLRAKYRMEAAWGLDIFDRKVFLWGHSGSFAPGLAGRIARLRQPWEDRLRNRLRLSAYRMGAEDLDGYLRRMARFRPASIYGYSTATYLLAQRAATTGLGCDTLKLAILSGEPAFPHLVTAVQRSLRVPAVIEYGAVECGFIAGQGPDGLLRVREDMTMLETLPRADGLFDLVVTVLSNPSFPLIRYAIDDVTSAPLEIPPKGFAVLKDVGGRRNDVLVSRSGRLVHSLGIKHVFEHCPGVRRFRAHQGVSGELAVTLETGDQNTRLDTTGAERQLRELLEDYPIHIEVVESLPPTLAGKHRWVVSDLAEKQALGGSS
jgi:phenylacetate-CoA ligase